jgi:squalene cyclase
LSADPVAAALAHIASTQDASGSWKGDYGGPLFLLPIFIAIARTVGYRMDDGTRSGMDAYLRAHQNGDGGWGLHVEGGSHVFTTALGYVALRFLDAVPDDPALVRAREFLRSHGGPLASASWGKFTLAVLGLYDWDGLHPVPPELWLLPEGLPFHPSRLWCHSRMVYLPMAYLYGRRSTVPLDDTLIALRSELYGNVRWEEIDWRAARDTVAATDRYVPHSSLARLAFRALDLFERRHSPKRRGRAIARVLAIIRAEDAATDYICLGPVNKLFNTLVWHFESPQGPELTRHTARLPDYLWRAKDGVKMQGYNSSQLWDTAFMVQAIFATGREAGQQEVLRSAARYIDQNQVVGDVPDREHAYRDASRGGWPFSTRAHGWPISDCTAEGLKASLLLAPHVETPISSDRLASGGGPAALDAERRRRLGDLRKRAARLARAAEPFGLLRGHHDRPVVRRWHLGGRAGACRPRSRHPGERTGDVVAAIDQGREFMLRAQREDGSWEGSWGICFTYGTWFGTYGLRAAGVDTTHPALTRAADFLVGKQLPDGGWGETAESCRSRTYVHAEAGQAVMTSWALLALAAAGRAESEPVRRGVAFLIARQRSDGSFPEERIAGMFNKTCAIHYDNYLKIFPVWALGALRPAHRP